MRDYGHGDQLGLEKTPEEYVANMVKVFHEVKRVLRKDGVCFLNLGDSYNSTPIGRQVDPKRKVADGGFSYDFKKPFWDSIPAKNLIGIPWRVAFALQADGWYLRQDIIWAKPNPMPESVTDRCTKSHEYIFLLSKSSKYYFDSESIKEPATTFENRPSGVVRDREYNYDSKQKAMGRHKNLQEKGQQLHSFHKSIEQGIPDSIPETRNKRSVWTINTKPFSGAHFAVFPPEIPELCIKAGSKEGDAVLDPFFGAGTTGLVAKKAGRKYIGIELNPAYAAMAEKRLAQETLF